jgi:hypothetical protein
MHSCVAGRHRFQLPGFDDLPTDLLGVAAIVRRQALACLVLSAPSRVCGVRAKSSSDRQRFRICYCRRGRINGASTPLPIVRTEAFSRSLVLSFTLSLFCTFTRFPYLQLVNHAVIARSYSLRRSLPTFGPSTRLASCPPHRWPPTRICAHAQRRSLKAHYGAKFASCKFNLVKNINRSMAK